MNRRGIIKAAIACTLVPSVSVAQSKDSAERRALDALRELADRDALDVYLLRVTMEREHWLRDYTLELLDDGVSMDEMKRLVRDRIKEANAS